MKRDEVKMPDVRKVEHRKELWELYASVGCVGNAAV